MTLFDDNKEYDDFVDKFKPKKTTDDCYTPQAVYDAVLNWAINEYGLHSREVIRPFYPDGDYEAFPYPNGCVVIDNPPFSILARIIDFYNAKKIDYFLFAPALTIFSTAGERANSIVTDSSITYENGAVVATSFITNLGEWKVHVAPDLHDAVEDAMADVLRQKRVTLPKYVYPDNVLVASVIQKIASRGQSLKIPAGSVCFIRALDSQRKQKKGIFGSGFLISEKAAAEKAAAEKAAAEKAAAEKAAAEKAAAEKAAAEKAAAIRWPLSDRELAIIARLGVQDK